MSFAGESSTLITSEPRASRAVAMTPARGADHSIILGLRSGGGVAIGPRVISGEVRSTVDVPICSGHVAIRSGAEKSDDGPDFGGAAGPAQVGGMTKILRDNPHRVGEAGAVHASLWGKRSQISL